MSRTPARAKALLFAASGLAARLTLSRYGHVIDELEDTPQLEAEAQLPTHDSPPARTSPGRCEN